MSRDKFDHACALLSRMPSVTEWNEGQAELYAIGLGAMPEQLLMDVVTRAVLTRTARPTVADLLGIAEEVVFGSLPSPEDAWQEVATLISTRGAYCVQDPEHPNIFLEGTPRFTHPLIEQAVVRMGGWRSMCAAETEMAALRDRFRSVYAELADRARESTRDSLTTLGARGRDGRVRQHRSRAALRVAHGR